MFYLFESIFFGEVGKCINLQGYDDTVVEKGA